MPIPVKKVPLEECLTLTGLVVVIDVIRAFTTASFAFSQGAEKIFLVGDIEEAFDLFRKFPEALLAGEEQGIPIPGFHFSNSPFEISKANLSGKTIIFRTSSGTQGVVKSVNAERILVSSFVIAEATYKRIMTLNPSGVSCVITGTRSQVGGEEDLALADYIDQKLNHALVEPQVYLERVMKSKAALRYIEAQDAFSKPADVELVCKLDQFPFALEVFEEGPLKVLYPVDRFGKKLKLDREFFNGKQT